MTRIFILLLIFTAFSTVLSLKPEIAQKLSRQLCRLAYGANRSLDLINVLDTKCKPDCDIDAKEIIFVCDNKTTFCDAAKAAFGDIITMLNCEWKCNADDKKSTVSIHCDSIKY